jgi:DNA-binding XRE family transcriptional regulator
MLLCMTTHTVEVIGPAWTWGDRVRKVRRETGLSQGAFAVRIGATPSAVAAWEVSNHSPRDVVAWANEIGAAFPDVTSVAWMLGLGEGSPTPPPRSEPRSGGNPVLAELTDAKRARTRRKSTERYLTRAA